MMRFYPAAITSVIALGLVIMASDVLAGGEGCTNCTSEVGGLEGPCCVNGCGVLENCNPRARSCHKRCRSGDAFDMGKRQRHSGASRNSAACNRVRGALSALKAVPIGDGGCGATSEDCLPNYCGLQSPQYPVPLAAPQHVSWHHFTYSPMMPHHALPHHRHTYAYRHGPGLSRTTVHWTKRPFEDTVKYLHHLISLPTPR